MTPATLRPLGKLFVICVGMAGAAVIGHSAGQLFVTRVDYRWLILAVLTLFSGPFSIKVPSLHSRISVSETFVFALALLFGPAVATVTVALDGLFISLSARNRTTYRTIFNIAEPSVSVWLSAQLF